MIGESFPKPSWYYILYEAYFTSRKSGGKCFSWTGYASERKGQAWEDEALIFQKYYIVAWVVTFNCVVDAGHYHKSHALLTIRLNRTNRSNSKRHLTFINEPLFATSKTATLNNATKTILLSRGLRNLQQLRLVW